MTLAKYWKRLKMLVLTRHKGQSVMVGDKVEITIASVRNNKVRLGVTAPREMSVHRKEIYETIRRKGCKEGGNDLGQLS